MADRFDTNPALYEQLVAKVLLGDDGAARLLVSLLIRRIANRYNPVSIRDDLIQEVWSHLWANNCRVLQQWNRTGPFVHFIAVVASRLMKSRIAQLPPQTDPIEDCPEPPDADDPEHTVEVRQLRTCLEKAKSRLSQMHRELIHLRHELGLQHREIAAKVGKTIGYVGSTLARAERYLREEVIDACADHLDSFHSILSR
jgi:RNA polymerase sigma factor (sigma-70 family)